MGKVTQLKQGNMDGLRRQVNECLENAYRRGFDDGRIDAYEKGLEDGNKIADKDLKGTYDVAYTKGYNTAINDYNKMIQWLHDCTDDFKKFIQVKYGYDIMYLLNSKVDEGVMLYNLICDHDMAEVIGEFQKWIEEKKQAETKIQVGDEVQFVNGSNGVVISINEHYLRIVMHDGFAMTVLDQEVMKKTGKNFSAEVSQLLSKLKGEE